jgi:hypothetical protein
MRAYTVESKERNKEKQWPKERNRGEVQNCLRLVGRRQGIIGIWGKTSKLIWNLGGMQGEACM